VKGAIQWHGSPGLKHVLARFGDGVMWMNIGKYGICFRDVYVMESSYGIAMRYCYHVHHLGVSPSILQSAGHPLQITQALRLNLVPALACDGSRQYREVVRWKSVLFMA